MIVGIPTEVKTDEYRVAITPAGVRELTSAGHTVLVEKGAGSGSSSGMMARCSRSASRLISGAPQAETVDVSLPPCEPSRLYSVEFRSKP